MPRVVSFARAFTGWEFLPWVGLVLGAAWSISARKERAGCFVGLFMAFAFVLFALQKMGQGVARNAQFELQFAVAIAVGLASDRLVAIALRSKRGARIATIVFLAVLAREVALFLTLPIPRTILPDFREELRDRAAVANSEVERIRGMPGLFACSQMITCFQAGKPFLYDFSPRASVSSPGHGRRPASMRRLPHARCALRSRSPRGLVTTIHDRMS